jgi:hypothetical protein
LIFTLINFSIILGLFVFMSFWLDPKGPKDQDLAKLTSHKAGRWPAAKSSPAPINGVFGDNLVLPAICENLESPLLNSLNSLMEKKSIPKITLAQYESAHGLAVVFPGGGCL